jgi:hypothetical protein
VNLCKIPTQALFTESMGLPLTMTPDYSDLSCRMTFGQVPPPLEEDPVVHELCYTKCTQVGKLPRCHLVG